MAMVTKAKINLKEGTIELEGTEAFVSKYLEIFKKEMKEVRPPIAMPKDEFRETREKKKKRKAKKSPATVAPISLDLKKNSTKPSLRTFAKEKDPATFTEKLTVFAYYLKKHLSIEKMKPGHVVSCCKEIKSRVPKNIPQLFYNIQQHRGWVDVGEKGEYVTITTAGENFVEYDLPKKESTKKNKTNV